MTTNVFLRTEGGRIITRPVEQGWIEGETKSQIIRLSYHYSLVITDQPLPLLVHRVGRGIFAPGWTGDETPRQREDVGKLILAAGFHLYLTREIK